MYYSFTNNISGQLSAVSGQLPIVDMKTENFHHRIDHSIAFTDALLMPLSFKIPVYDKSYVDLYPDVFVAAKCQYGTNVDAFLFHSRSGLRSETEVVSLDFNWQNIMDKVCNLNIYFNEQDDSSRIQSPSTRLCCNVH